MKRIIAAVLLLAVAGASLALVPGGSVEFLDARIAEIDGSLLRIKVDLAEGRVPDAQKADFAALQRSLENEKALLVDRKAVLLRLEPQSQSQSQSVADVADTAPATSAGVPAVAAPTNPMAPLTSPKPKIPDAVCQQRLSGWVGLEFAVLPDGKVADVKVTASQPQGAFDSSAVEAVSGRTYMARPLPVKMKEKMFMSFTDCRAEQLRADAGGTQATVLPAGDCANIATSARAVGAPFDPAESGRAVLAGGAQVYSAPSAQCSVAGKRLKPGTPLTARIEYQEFSLVSAKGAEEMWVRSNQLKDTAP